ncbi:hypothetical protein LTR27_012576 [Elasticomyces elasticus]|nr:hypothetical protein LTR27_012576 [Elasticomyces elasticus]
MQSVLKNDLARQTSASFLEYLPSQLHLPAPENPTKRDVQSVIEMLSATKDTGTKDNGLGSISEASQGHSKFEAHPNALDDPARYTRARVPGTDGLEQRSGASLPFRPGGPVSSDCLQRTRHNFDSPQCHDNRDHTSSKAQLEPKLPSGETRDTHGIPLLYIRPIHRNTSGSMLSQTISGSVLPPSQQRSGITGLACNMCEACREVESVKTTERLITAGTSTHWDPDNVESPRRSSHPLGLPSPLSGYPESVFGAMNDLIEW